MSKIKLGCPIRWIPFLICFLICFWREQMTKKIHIAVGVAATLPIITVNTPILFIGVLGAIVPDWDILILGMKYHRTITHSFVSLLISTLIVSLFNVKLGLIWGISYLTHLLLDSFTKMGVPVFYPFNKKYYGFKLIRTGGSEDLFAY